MIPERIVLAGTGNVASHLCKALGDRITAVASRDINRARNLAMECGIPHAVTYDGIADIMPEIVIVSVADHAVQEVIDAIGPITTSPIVVHTSGTLHKEILESISRRTGILYPLQTFSKDVAVDMSNVPFFTEATSEQDLTVIDSIAHLISGNIHHADSANRQILHIAGVFSSNFVNILLEMVEDILAQANYPLDIVKPLVEATVAKAFEAGPHNAQTGPARRGDTSVMSKHTAALPYDKRQVYELLSQYIIKSQNTKLQ